MLELALAGIVAFSLLWYAHDTSGGGALSAVRQQALAILAEVVPSGDGDSRFAKLGWDAVAAGPGATSCGALPCYLGRRLGDPTGITRCGVPGVRTEGIKRRAWVEGGKGVLPRPGDILLFSGDPAGQVIKHTAVLTERKGDLWTTADAGQGTREHQRAAYVVRRYNAKDNTIRRADAAPGTEPRYLVGFVDLERALKNAPKGLIEPAAPAPWPCDPNECA